MNKLVVAAVSTGSVALGLSACTAPTPDVTVWSGTSSVVRPASCWAPDSSASEAVKSCISAAKAGQSGDIPSIAVTPGNVIGINVDDVVAQAGWTPSIGGQALTPNPAPLTQSYFRFTYPGGAQTPADGYVLAITARGDAAASDRGIWLFRLVPGTIR